MTLWILPGVVGLVLSDDSPTYTTVQSRLNEGVVAILAAGLLFLLPMQAVARVGGRWCTAGSRRHAPRP